MGCRPSHPPDESLLDLPWQVTCNIPAYVLSHVSYRLLHLGNPHHYSHLPQTGSSRGQYPPLDAYVKEEDWNTRLVWPQPTIDPQSHSSLNFQLDPALAGMTQTHMRAIGAAAPDVKREPPQEKEHASHLFTRVPRILKSPSPVPGPSNFTEVSKLSTATGSVGPTMHGRKRRHSEVDSPELPADSRAPPHQRRRQNPQDSPKHHSPAGSPVAARSTPHPRPRTLAQPASATKNGKGKEGKTCYQSEWKDGLESIKRILKCESSTAEETLHKREFWILSVFPKC